MDQENKVVILYINKLNKTFLRSYNSSFKTTLAYEMQKQRGLTHVLRERPELDKSDILMLTIPTEEYQKVVHHTKYLGEIRS